LAAPKFLDKALPLFMRGAYLRSVDDSSLEEIKSLDNAISNFLKKSIDDISDTFLGRKAAFSAELNGARFQVGRGYITVDHPAGHLTTIYFPAE
jgi:hypothetical protein